MSEALASCLKRIWASPGWEGTVVIECDPDRGVSVFWKVPGVQKDEDDHSPDATATTIPGALALAAAQADSIDVS